MLDAHLEAILSTYPALHAAWRRREVRDPGSGRRLSDHLAGILEQLDQNTLITVGTLAQRLRVTPATISIQLNRLVRLRLVARERDPADARRVLLRLTEAGSRLRGRRSLLDPERVRAALGRLGGDEREAAVAGLRLLARAAGETPVPPNSRPTASRRQRRTPE